MIEIKSADDQAILHVGMNLAPADELEVMTVASRSEIPQTPLSAVEWAVNASSDSFAVHPVLDGTAQKPCALFGIVPDEERSPGMAVVWMVTTPMLLSTSRDILKQAPAWIDSWLFQYPNGLHNLVDVRNTRHKKWLEKMGAEFNNTGQMIRAIPFAYFKFSPRFTA